jgi:hypothetical protein
LVEKGFRCSIALSFPVQKKGVDNQMEMSDEAPSMDPNVTLTAKNMDDQVDEMGSDPVIDLTDEHMSPPPPDLAESLKRPRASNDTNLDIATPDEEIDLTDLPEMEEEPVVVLSKSGSTENETSEKITKKRKGSAPIHWEEIVVGGGGAGEEPIDLTRIDDSQSMGSFYPPIPGYGTVCYGLIESLLTGTQNACIDEGFASGATAVPVTLQPFITPIQGVYSKGLNYLVGNEIGRCSLFRENSFRGH